jgi:hypothetical protein
MAKLFILIISILLYSCSAQYHLNKAIKKGYVCEDIADTLTITKLDSVLITKFDTTYYETFLKTFDTIVQWKTQYVPKTRLDKRIEYKIKVKTIYKDRIVEKAKARAEGQKAKSNVKLHRPKGNLNLLFVGVGIGLLLSYLFKFAREKYSF